MKVALRARVAAASGLPLKQVAWGVLPQGVPYPAILLSQIAFPAGYTLKGRDGTQQYRVQIDHYGPDHQVLDAQDVAVTAALEQAQGQFLAGFDLGANDTYRGSGDDAGREAPIQRISRDFKLTIIPA